MYRENKDWLVDYLEYTTIYKNLGNGYQFSDDGSVAPEVVVLVVVETTADELAEWERQEKITDLNNQIAAIDSEFTELDYIGIKIVTGSVTTEEYTTEIAKMEKLAIEKDNLLEKMKALEVVE